MMPKDKKIKMNSKLKVLKIRTEVWKMKYTKMRMKKNKKRMRLFNRMSLMI